MQGAAEQLDQTLAIAFGRDHSVADIALGHQAHLIGLPPGHEAGHVLFEATGIVAGIVDLTPQDFGPDSGHVGPGQGVGSDDIDRVARELARRLIATDQFDRRDLGDVASVDHGAALALNAPFERAQTISGGFRVDVGGKEPMSLTCRLLINSAGLIAPMVAKKIEGLPAQVIPQARFAKGSYFSLKGKSPFSRLIYPAPHTHGLGVHLTLDLAGQARFGPDVEWVETIDYAVNSRRMEGFSDAIRRYWPGLPDDALIPAYSGIRPKISGPDEPAMDFRIDGPETHGLAGLVNLFGIESPGLTASLAIAADIAARLRD